MRLLTADHVKLGFIGLGNVGKRPMPQGSAETWLEAAIASFIVGKSGYSAIFLYGSGAAGCAFVLTPFLYHLVSEPSARLSRRTLDPLETGEQGRFRY